MFQIHNHSSTYLLLERFKESYHQTSQGSTNDDINQDDHAIRA